MRIEQIVGELEGLAEGRGITHQRGTFGRLRAAEHGAGLAGEAEQSARFQRLHLRDFVRVEALPFGGEIERLAERHAVPATGSGQQQDKLGANGRIGVRLRIAQDLEGQRQ